jgi:mono/diheme cytochrome c family protein
MTYSTAVKTFVLAAAAALAVVAAAMAAPAKEAGAPVAAKSLYDRYCSACHGLAGDGAGPAAPLLHPKPRDFTKGVYKWRSTPTGQPPTDEDLARSIREGAAGTSMPAYAGILDEKQIAALAAYIRSFGPTRRGPSTPIAAPTPPAELAALIPRGEALFAEAGCPQCHGPDAEVRYDLSREPLRRAARKEADVWLSLATGLDGTSMPSYQAALSDDDLWALAAWAVKTAPKPPGARSGLPMPEAIRKDASPVGLDIPAQGPPPASLPPAAASLSSKQCGRCHAKQLREWKGSIHAAAASPGLIAQLVDKTALAAPCQACHAPLAEQLADTTLRDEGITCAVCHLRGWTRRGPPRRADATLLAIPSYPVVEDEKYERSEGCMPCHQLEPRDHVAGRPLLDTYREWLEGPYMARGVQCQHCHMPDREHSWKGVHDRETVAQAVAVDGKAERRADGVVTVTVTIDNVGAGHHFPTTPTPAAWLTVDLLDSSGKPIAKLGQTRRIGRDIEHTAKGWIEKADTRIPAGRTSTFTLRFVDAAAGKATRARATLSMAPDDFYEGFYRRALARKNLPDEAKQLYQAALDRATRSRFDVHHSSWGILSRGARK